MSYDLVFGGAIGIAICCLLGYIFGPKRAKDIPLLMTVFLFFGLMILIGNRPNSVGTDTEQYVSHVWPRILASDSLFYVKGEAGANIEMLYVVCVKILGVFFEDLKFGHAVVYFIFAVGLSLLIGFRWTGLFLLLWMLNVVFVGSSINVLRFGISYLFVYIGMVAYIENRQLLGVTLLFVSVCVHYYTMIVCVSLLIVSVVKSRRAMEYLAVLVCLISYAMNGMHLFDWVYTLLAQSIREYGAGSGYQTGFRWDFLLFTFVQYLIVRLANFEFDEDVEMLLRLYLVLAMLFVIGFGLPYSDRIGMYSWGLMALIILYVIRRNGLDHAKWVAVGVVASHVLVSLYFSLKSLERI